MSNYLIPILVFSLPVLAVVVLALSGRKLKGSCGGVSPDGSCSRCGKPAAEMAAAGSSGECSDK